MIVSDYTEWFPKNGVMAVISLRIESWQNTSQSFLTIDGETTRYGDPRDGTKAYLEACARLGSKESWQWEHGVD